MYGYGEELALCNMMIIVNLLDIPQICSVWGKTRIRDMPKLDKLLLCTIYSTIRAYESLAGFVKWETEPTHVFTCRKYR